MLEYHESPPPPELARHVRCFWTLRGDGAALGPQTVPPDGTVELIFHRGDPFVQRVGDTLSMQPRALVVGDIRRPVTIAPTGAVDVVGIRFRPGRAYPFFPLPMRALRDGIVDLRDLGIDEPRDLTATLTNALRNGEEDRALDAAVDLIVRTRGRLPIARVATMIGVSERQLERKFDARVGVAAKVFSRVIRFQSVVRALAKGDADRDFGHADQSHLIREFREFAGVTPTQFADEPLLLANLFLA